MRTEPCACGGSITATSESAYSIRFAVEEHNKGWEHQALVGNLWPHLCSTCRAVRTLEEECHGCSGRFSGPLTAAKLAEWGLGGGV